MGADKDAFRAVMRRYPTGVTVVTTRAGEVDHGMTANAVVPVSLEPILFLISVDHTARLHDLVPEAGSFVVNMLSAEQEKVSRTFALKELSDEERWATVTTHPSTVGALRIDGCVGYLDCRLTDSFPGGDHTLYLGEVVEVVAGADRPPLLFYGSAYRSLAPDERP